MKKFFTLVAAAATVIAANAGTRVLYNQDFESVTSAAEAGWTYGGEKIELQSDDFGSFLALLQGATNGRNAQCTWGDGVYVDKDGAPILEDGVYTLTFDFSPKQSSNNQYNSGITVLTNQTPPANQPFLGRWTYIISAAGDEITDMSMYQSYLFDLTQVQRETEDTGSIQWKVNGDADNLITMASDWYTIDLVVNVNERTVDYNVADLSGTVLTSGTRTVPATDCDGSDISMYATGLWVMVARYQTQFLFDNIRLSCESTADVANNPSVAMTGIGQDLEGNINLSSRIYTITFLEGETLVVEGPDGVTTEVDFYDCDGSYKYQTTTSGTLSAYTKCGTAVSEKISVEVDATPYALPAAVTNIVSVSAGYGKTYKLTVDNSTVPMAPVIFITATFNGDQGEVVELKNQGTGVTLTVTQPGKLTITTDALGYQPTTITVNNSIEYNEKAVYDIARMTVEEIQAAGFKPFDDLNSGATSGENNWTARKRMFYYDAASATVDPESGETVHTAVYPFGYIADDDTDHVMHRWQIADTENTEAAPANPIPGLVIWPGATIQILQNVGVMQNSTAKNYNTIKVKNLAASDIVIFNTIGSYGADSCHPVCNSVEEYYAQLGGTDTAYVTGDLGKDVLGAKDAGAYKIEEEDGTLTMGFQLYRIDTVLVKATVFAAGEDGIEDVRADKVIDNAWYTINGMRLDAPTTSGLYIHNGKKVIIRK